MHILRACGATAATIFGLADIFIKRHGQLKSDLSKAGYMKARLESCLLVWKTYSIYFFFYLDLVLWVQQRHCHTCGYSVYVWCNFINLIHSIQIYHLLCIHFPCIVLSQTMMNGFTRKNQISLTDERFRTFPSYTRRIHDGCWCDVPCKYVS